VERGERGIGKKIIGYVRECLVKMNIDLVEWRRRE
jgi:hypothetical protein